MNTHKPHIRLRICRVHRTHLSTDPDTREESMLIDWQAIVYDRRVIVDGSPLKLMASVVSGLPAYCLSDLAKFWGMVDGLFRAGSAQQDLQDYYSQGHGTQRL